MDEKPGHSRRVFHLYADVGRISLPESCRSHPTAQGPHRSVSPPIDAPKICAICEGDFRLLDNLALNRTMPFPRSAACDFCVKNDATPANASQCEHWSWVQERNAAFGRREDWGVRALLSLTTSFAPSAQSASPRYEGAI